jgi:pimeloyl-ACP methyl ester carboxylesterase
MGHVWSSESRAIAVPLFLFDLGSLPRGDKPLLLVSADRDDFCPFAALRRHLDAFDTAATAVNVPSADHFLFGHEREVGDAVVRFLAA